MNTSSGFLFGMTLDQLVPLGAGITIAAFVLLIWYSLIERDPVSARAKAVRQHKKQLAVQQARNRGEKSRLTMLSESRLNKMARDLRTARGDQADKIRMMLAQAGFRSNEAMGVYVLAKFLGPLVAVTLGFIVFYALPQMQELPFIIRAGALVVIAVSGLILPDTIVGRMAKSRGRKIEAGLPDALDLMVICTEAGLSLDAAFDRVSSELGTSHDALSDELSLTSVELNILPNRVEALNNLMERTNVQAIESVVSTLSQTERYGTPLAQSFRILASDFRESRLLRAEEKAARLPATLTVPMIGFIFPCLFAVLLGPAIIQVLHTFE